MGNTGLLWLVLLFILRLLICYLVIGLLIAGGFVWERCRDETGRNQFLTFLIVTVIWGAAIFEILQHRRERAALRRRLWGKWE